MVKMCGECSASRRIERAQVWSPDGKQIAYRRREPSGSFIYIATIDGKNEEKIAFGSSPAWSPDGKEIAFLTGWPERMRITILNVKTRKQRVFFPKPVKPSWMTSPAWSPSGDKIAFTWLHQAPLKEFVDTETIYIIKPRWHRASTNYKRQGPDRNLASLVTSRGCASL